MVSSLPWLYRSCYDVVLYTLLFHGRRAEKYSLFSGCRYSTHGFANFAEAMGAGGAVVTPDRTVDECLPANKVVALRNLIAGTDQGHSHAAAMYSSPLNYRPLPAKDRREIIAGLGDRLAPPEHAATLWKHRDRCALH